MVRDRIPDIIRAKGETPNVHRTHPDDRYGYLMAKLHEEVAEFVDADSDGQALEELADVAEVLDALAVEHGSDLDEVLALKRAKRTARGGFDEGWIWTAP
jgi:predicted house-cleaning noncanonical NTP pyrophosphatase (MazG superfamily)